jgi:dipeptidyl aminopeptidase/acylaminoacyl peptidase
MDDNVHIQNSLQLIEELQRTDKRFETMFYPRSRHGLGRGSQRLIFEFFQRTLGGPTPASTPPNVTGQP